MGVGQGVSALVVFLQGLLGFFSPCVLPIVPLYAAYLAGSAGGAVGASTADPAAKTGGASEVAGSPAGAAAPEAGAVGSPSSPSPARRRKPVLLVNTLCFVLGICCTFFILGAGATALGQAFGANHDLLATVGGIVVIVLGVVQFFAYGRTTLFGREFRLPFDLGRFAMSPLVAFALGFFFSFAWTPCVGPALTSVLIMASSASSAALGFALIGVYTLGFALPFLAVGFAADRALGFFARHRAVVAVTVKVGSVLLVVMGVLILTGWMNSFSRSMAFLAM